MSAFGFGFGGPKKEEPKQEEKKEVNLDDELVEEEEIAITGEAKFAAVEVTSGEEKYEKLCAIKSKIWRFDEGENQWKERGAGEVRILKNKTKADDHVFLFRRDGVGKLAAYHSLVKGMKIVPAGKSDCKFVWTSTMDFADDEDEGFPETFAVKFADAEVAAPFLKLFKSITGCA